MANGSFPGGWAGEPILGEAQPPDHGAFVGGVDDLDPAIATLEGGRVTVVAVGIGQEIASDGKGTGAIGGQGDGQRGAIGEAVVVDKQVMAVGKAEEIDGGIGIGEFGIGSVRPSAPAVVGFGADHPAIGLPLVIAAAATERDEMLILDDGRGGLDVAQP